MLILSIYTYTLYIHTYTYTSCSWTVQTCTANLRQPWGHSGASRAVKQLAFPTSPVCGPLCSRGYKTSCMRTRSSAGILAQARLSLRLIDIPSQNLWETARCSPRQELRHRVGQMNSPTVLSLRHTQRIEERARDRVKGGWYSACERSMGRFV